MAGCRDWIPFITTAESSVGAIEKYCSARFEAGLRLLRQQQQAVAVITSLDVTRTTDFVTGLQYSTAETTRLGQG